MIAIRHCDGQSAPCAPSACESRRRCLRTWLASLAFAGAIAPAHAGQVAPMVDITPRGTVSTVRQVTARFSEPMNETGGDADGRPVDFLMVRCEGSPKPIVEEHGHWVDSKTLVLDLEDPIPARTRCQVTLKPGMQTSAGMALPPPLPVAFETGGPAIQRTFPGGQAVAERQVFAFLFNGKVDAATVRASAYCEVATSRTDATPWRMGVVPITGKERDVLATAFRFQQHQEQVATFRCAQALPDDALVTVVWTPEQTAAGIPATPPERHTWNVRPAFSARFDVDCGDASVLLQRRGGLRCDAATRRVDVDGMVQLRFSRPVPVAQAFRARLTTSSGSRVPRLGDMVGERNNDSPLVTGIRFKGPFASGDHLVAVLPTDLADPEGNRRINAAQPFAPIQVAPGLGSFEDPVDWKPGPFAVMGRTADATIHVDLLRSLHVNGVQVLRVPSEATNADGFDDAPLIRWFQRLERYQGYGLIARDAAVHDLGAKVVAAVTPLVKAPPGPEGRDVLSTSSFSLLAGESASAPGQLDESRSRSPGRRQATMALDGPGLHVVELGYDSPEGDSTVGPAFARTGILVTDLAVHVLRVGQTIVWVTSLSTGKPVANAVVQESDEDGEIEAVGVTDGQGVAKWREGFARTGPHKRQAYRHGDRFFSARRPLGNGLQDVAFAMYSWDSGLGLDSPAAPGTEGVVFGAYFGDVQSFLGRRLLAPGQTVSAKHWMRATNYGGGITLPRPDQWPKEVFIVDPAGAKVVLPLSWSERGDAQWNWVVPPDALRGQYQVQLDGHQVDGAFEVQDFQEPDAEISLEAPGTSWRAGRDVALDVHARYRNGGPAAGMAVDVQLQRAPSSAEEDLPFRHELPDAFRRLQFDNGDVPKQAAHDEAPDFDHAFPEADAAEVQDDVHAGAPLLSRRSGTVDSTGRLRLRLKTPAVSRPTRVQTTLSFADSDGQERRLSRSEILWPSSRRVGVALRRQPDGTLRLDAGVLDLSDRPVAGVAVGVQLSAARRVDDEPLGPGSGLRDVLRKTTWQRLALPPACRLVTNSSGLASCSIDGHAATSVLAVVRVADDAGGAACAHEQAWPELGSDPGTPWHPLLGGLPFHPRHLPGSKTPAPLEIRAGAGLHAVGQTVQARVRGRFDRAPALVTIVRGGLSSYRVMTLDGDDPVLEFKVDRDWAPGVFVGVLALQRQAEAGGQGQVGDRPAPVLRTGWRYIRVDPSPNRLVVRLAAASSSVRPGDMAHLKIKVLRADGRPAPANAHVALAVLNDALFDHMRDDSDVLERLLTVTYFPPINVATAQSFGSPQPLGARDDVWETRQRYRWHPEGEILTADGVGKLPDKYAPPVRLRSVLDSALAWLPNVSLDATGSAAIDIPTNDALAHWRVIAVADASTPEEAMLTGRAQTSFDTRRPLQLGVGLPAMVRTGDRMAATIFLRNDSDAAMHVRVTARAATHELAGRAVDIAAHGVAQVGWDVAASDSVGDTAWEFAATADNAATHDQDRIQFHQQVLARVPVTVREGTLVRLNSPLDLPLHAGSAQARVSLHTVPALVSEMPEVTAYLRDDRLGGSLEIDVSNAIGRRDEAAWARIIERLPSCFDADDLLSLFPIIEGAGSNLPGTSATSSYVLSITAQAQALGLPFGLPAALRQRIAAALIRVAKGELVRDDPYTHGPMAPTLRRLAAAEALSRIDAARPAMLADVAIDPEWPTSALINLRGTVGRLTAYPDRAALLRRIDDALRARLDVRGTRVNLVHRNEWSGWMQGEDVNEIRLATLAVDDPAWSDIAPRLLMGALSRQRDGHWSNVLANALGMLMARDFGQRAGAGAVSGKTLVGLGGQVPSVIDWTATPSGATLDIPLGADTTPTLEIRHAGAGAPWLTALEAAAVDATRAIDHGFAIRKSITSLTPHPGGALRRGDLLHVHLDIEAASDSTGVVLNDPIPAGASVVVDKAVAGDAPRRDDARPSGSADIAYVERRLDRYQVLFSTLWAGHRAVDYDLRVNTAGRFGMPATRVEVKDAPDIFGESPNPAITVDAR